MAKLKLTIACGDYDIVRPLKEGLVECAGIELIFLTDMGPRERHWRMGRKHEFDVCEENVGAYYMIRDQGEPLTAIPVFLHRRFRHGFVFINTAAGIRQVEPNYIRLARSLGYSPTLIFFKTILPAAAPTIMAGLRLGFGYTIIGIMAAELLVVNAGIGFLIDRASFNYHTAQLYALIIITLGIGAVGNSLFGLIERRWAR